MALPNIPTSFVPYSGSSSARQGSTDFTGAFAFFGYGVLVIMFILAIGVFSYGQVLSSNQATKDKLLATEQSQIDQASIQSFVKLRDRLITTKSLMSKHIAVSGFFDFIGTLLPTTVRFTSLHLTLGEEGSVAGPKLSASGSAKNFNALASVSKSFAVAGSIKDAIFSGINISSDKTVSFNLTATVDPNILYFAEVQKSAVHAATINTATSTSP